jgi:hypothetical protein
LQHKDATMKNKEQTMLKNIFAIGAIVLLSATDRDAMRR